MRAARVTFLTWLIMLLLLAPSLTPAAELQVASETLFLGLERQATTGKKLSLVPAYEYLQLDYGSLDIPGLSLHLNGWGRLNLADNYNNNDTGGELLHAYLQYEPVKQTYQLRVGRQYIFEGVAHDSIDGIYGKTFLAPGVTASAYAGSPVSFDTVNGRKGDLIFGGKVTYSRPKLFDAGLSYKYVADNGRKDESLGADLTLLLPGDVTLQGHSVYNLISNGWGEHSYHMRFSLGPATLQPFVDHFQYESLFTNNSATPFRFLKGTGIDLTVVGTDAFWYPTEHEELVLRFKNYDYNKRFSASQYYSLLAIQKWKILSEAGVEFGRMQGGEAENRYSLGRGYFYWSVAPGFVTGDVMVVYYDQAIYSRNTSLFCSAGIGRKFLKNRLGLKLSFDYSHDPYFNEDYRWLLKVDYRLDKTSSGLL